MTYAELKAKLDALTPEQLAMTVSWSGECRGGDVKCFEVLAEDHINPSGEGMEPVSAVRKMLLEEEHMSSDDVERWMSAEKVVCPKGQPLLVVD